MILVVLALAMKIKWEDNQSIGKDRPILQFSNLFDFSGMFSSIMLQKWIAIKRQLINLAIWYGSNPLEIGFISH